MIRNLFTRWLLSMVTALFLILAVSVALAEDSGSLSFRHIGTPTKNTASVYQQENSKSEVLAQIEKGEQCEIISSLDRYYRVRFQEHVGYVPKSQLTLSYVQQEVPEALCDTLSLKTYTPNRHEKYLLLQGTITFDQPLETLRAYVWDERRLRLEHVYTKQLDEPATQIDASLLEKMLPENKLTGGRKTLVLEGCSAQETVVLYRTLLYAFGELNEPVHVTGKCKGLPATVQDEKISTAWVPTKSNPALVFKIPEEANAVLLTLEWKVVPTSFTVELMDENGDTLSRLEKSTGFYSDAIALTDQVRSVSVTMTGKNAALGNLRVYGENYPTHAVQEWEPLPEKLDILLISTHQDDEFLFFGGSIPYYAAREDTTIGVLYMADCGRYRCREALDGLWASGLRQHPIFFGLEDKYTPSAGEAAALWRKDDPQRLLVQAFRKYRPEVILVQDFNGEYGHGQHKHTASLCAEGIALAADPSYDPESAEQLGTWQIKKCYVHLYEENQIHMDWDIPMDDTGVITPMFRAWEGFDKNKSQGGFSMERDGVKYDNTLFGLYWSTVGPDIEKNDFMENIP